MFGAISSSFQTRRLPVADVGGIVMFAEREMVLGLQPAMVGAAEFVEWSEFDHGIFLCRKCFASRRACVARVFVWSGQAPKPPSTLRTVPVTNEAAGLARKTTPACDLFRGAVNAAARAGALRFRECAVLRIHVGVDRTGLQHVDGDAARGRGRGPRPWSSRRSRPWWQRSRPCRGTWRGWRCPNRW